MWRRLKSIKGFVLCGFSAKLATDPEPPALLAAAVSILSGKHAVLATRLLGLMLLIFAVSIHLVALVGGDQAAMSNLLKDTSLAGGAFILSGVLAAGEGAPEA